jgi:hypothetical protein
LKRIEQMYAFVSEDPTDDTEGVCGHSLGPWMVPMVAADMERVEQLRPIAANLAQATGQTIRLVRFEIRTELEVFE